MVEIRELKPAVFDFEEPLSKILAELERTGTCVVITKNKKYKGIIDTRCVTRMPPDPAKAKAGRYAVPAPAVSRSSSLIEIIRLFFDSPFKALPVIEKEKPVAVIARAEVLEALAREKLLSKGSVSDFMSAPAVVISETDSIPQARARLREKNVKRLVVVDSEGRFSGVIGMYDFSTALSKPKEKPPLTKEKLGLSEQPVASLRREAVETISPSASLSDAALLMAGKNVSDLVVLQGAKPVGVISAKDIFGNVVVAAETARMEVSGLDEEDKEHRGTIIEYIQRFLRKASGGCAVQSLKLNVKKQRKAGERHRYRISAFLQTAREKFNASIEGWDLKRAAHDVLDELSKLLNRSKKSPMHRKGWRRP